MMWGDETGNDADLAAVKPDEIIFLKVPPSVARSWLKKELGNSSRSEAECQYLMKGNYGSFLDHHHKACRRFMDTTDIPHHEVELDENVTLKKRPCWFMEFRWWELVLMEVQELLFQYLMSCFRQMKRLNEDVKLSPMHLVGGFQ